MKPTVFVNRLGSAVKIHQKRLFDKKRAYIVLKLSKSTLKPSLHDENPIIYFFRQIGEKFDRGTGFR